MKTFRELYIHLNGIEIDAFSKDLDTQLKGGWIRRNDKEKAHDSIVGKLLCFEAEEGNSISPAALFIAQKADATLWVSNIVPTESSELNYDEYNSVLEDFYENIVLPAIDETPITAELTSDQISIGSIAGDEVERALITFSNLANKSTGSSHPLDKKRWLEFLILAHQSQSNLYSDMVIRTLVELGWSEEKAIQLGIEYEFAEDLLSYIEGR